MLPAIPWHCYSRRSSSLHDFPSLAEFPKTYYEFQPIPAASVAIYIEAIATSFRTTFSDHEILKHRLIKNCFIKLPYPKPSKSSEHDMMRNPKGQRSARTVIGGLPTSRVSWRSIFWFLALFSGAVFILLFLLLPETSRDLVGNGSIQVTGINKTFIDRFRREHMLTSPKVMPNSQMKFPNLLPCLRLIFHKNTGIVLFSNAVFYMKYSCAQASLAPLLQDTYGLGILEAGFCYLAFGSATAIASYGVGMITDYDYRTTALVYNFSIDRVRGDDLNKFPIEMARLPTVWLYRFVSATATLVYGWTLEYRTHLAVPLAMQFLLVWPLLASSISATRWCLT